MESNHPYSCVLTLRDKRVIETLHTSIGDAKQQIKLYDRNDIVDGEIFSVDHNNKATGKPVAVFDGLEWKEEK